MSGGRVGDNRLDQLSVVPVRRSGALAVVIFIGERALVARRRCGLFLAQFGAILSLVMKRWSARELFIMILAVFIAAGMSLSVRHGSGAATKMTITSDMGVSASHDVQDGDENVANDVACSAVCPTPVLASPPQAAPAALVHKPASFAARSQRLHGRKASPDPYPPKRTDIG